MASYTDDPKWAEKMKMIFKEIDENKAGKICSKDLLHIAGKFAGFGLKEIPQSETYDILNSVWGVGIGDGSVTADEFVQNMKKFVILPDARDRVKNLCKMIFQVADTNKDGDISYEEYLAYGKQVANMDETIMDTFFAYFDSDKNNKIDPKENEDGHMKFIFSA
jgi:Ca2+-binding EF-hand superfamily protein